MLGTLAMSGYKRVEDFATHKDYLSYMYGNVKGFIARSVISSNGYYESFGYADRLINRNSYHGIANVYTSLNTFLTKRKAGDNKSGRKVENLKRLNALYLDLDCYKIGLSQEQVLAALEDEYFGHTIPVPTFVINSGRGLYLIWKISEDRNALPRWKKVQQYLYDQCREFNADPQALDAARILRVPFSINEKNGETVRIMRFHDVQYTLYEIIKEYEIGQKYINKADSGRRYPYGEATARQRSVAQWQSNEFGVELPDFQSYHATFEFIKKYSRYHREDKVDNNVAKSKVKVLGKEKTINTMLDGRVSDLFRLFEMRKGGDCSREYALFLCRLWVGERTNDFDYALRQTQALNRTFDVPFDEQYVACRTKSAETKLRAGETYQYSLSKIIKVLNITDEEQIELNYLCANPKTQAACRKKSNRKAYLSRLKREGKQTKSDTLKERRETMAMMIAEGKDKAAICSALNISKRTYDRDKAAIVANGLLECAQNKVRETVEKIKDKLECTVETAVDDTLKEGSPFFKYIYYKRTPVGCSARNNSELYRQFDIWDIWDRKKNDCVLYNSS